MAEIDPLRLPELYDAVCQLQASLQSDEVIDAALKAAIKLTGAERAFIKSLDAYSSVYAVPKLEYATKRLIETPLEALASDVERSRQSILIVDTQNDPRFAAEPLAALFASRAMLIVPLQTPQDFLGGAHCKSSHFRWRIHDGRHGDIGILCGMGGNRYSACSVTGTPGSIYLRDQS